MNVERVRRKKFYSGGADVLTNTAHQFDFRRSARHGRRTAHANSFLRIFTALEEKEQVRQRWLAGKVVNRWSVWTILTLKDTDDHRRMKRRNGETRKVQRQGLKQEKKSIS